MGATTADKSALTTVVDLLQAVVVIGMPEQAIQGYVASKRRNAMWSLPRIVLLVTLLLVLFSGMTVSEEAKEPVVGFGFGGPMIGVFMPELDEVNEFLNDNGYAALGDSLIVAGGGGRGGVLGGLSIGGIGWGGTVTSLKENKQAKFSAGFGGCQLGYVVGGNERSLLTIGAVLGGGGVNLNLREVVPEDSGPCRATTLGNTNGPRSGFLKGIVIEPTPTNYCQGFIAVEPYLSMQVQPLGFLGFELHLGYLFTVLGFGCCGEAENSGPSLGLSGPFVGLSLTFGGIGAAEWGFPYSETVEETVDFAGRTTLGVENEIGSITIGPGADLTVQTGASSVVELVAVKQARTEEILAAVEIVIEESDKGLQIRSEAPKRYSGRWSVDFVLTVPVGIALQIEQGVGDITLSAHSGSVSIELGVGSVEIEQLFATELKIELGMGDLTLVDVECKFAQVEVGTGDVDIRLHPEAAYTVTGVVGLGDITIAGFPAMVLEQEGFIRKEAHAVLGEGAGQLVLVVGVGDIVVRPL